MIFHFRGEIVRANLRESVGGVASLFVRIQYVFGPDWTLLTGPEMFLTQIAIVESGQEALLNMPIDAIFSTSNLHGFPRIIISIFGVNGMQTALLGRPESVPIGHGSCLLPVCIGESIKVAELYRPISSKTGVLATISSLINFLNHDIPDYFDSRFVGQSTSRMVTRVEATSSVELQMSVATQNVTLNGYNSGAKVIGNNLNMSKNIVMCDKS